MGLLYYLFKKIPPAQVLQSLKYVNLPFFIAFSIFYFAAIMLLDTWSLSKVLTKFSVPVTVRQLLPARGISYLLSLVNYNAGQAAMAIYLKKTRGASFFKTLGSIFFVMVTDLYWIVLLAFCGSFFFEIQIPGIPLKSWVQRVGYICFAALILHLAFWRRWFTRFIPTKIHFGFSDWVRGRHLFQPFHHAQIKDYFKIALMRLPLHVIIISSMYIVLKLFGASIRFADILANIPIIFLLGAIPVTPGGLGAVQIATVELLKNHISSPAILQGTLKPEELLFAMSLTWMFTNYFLKALTGIIFLNTTSRELFKEDKI